MSGESHVEDIWELLVAYPNKDHALKFPILRPCKIVTEGDLSRNGADTFEINNMR